MPTQLAEARRGVTTSVMEQAARAEGVDPSAVRDEIAEQREAAGVGDLGDQDAGGKGHFVEFMGRPASVSRGPATMAVKAGCPMLMVFLYRQPDNSHVMKFEPTIEIDPAWDQETAIDRLTEIHTARLEQAVREAPQMYYWVHRRWKTRPLDPETSP